MTDNERDFEDFIGDVKFDDTPNHAHRDRFERDLAAAVAKQTRQKDQSPRVWRIIMKGRITKAASAAIIILAAVLTITVLNRSESAAWAIDQTIKALEKYDSLYVSGVFCDEKGVESGFDLWARPHSEDPTRSGDFRIEVKDKEIAVAIEEENITYRHDPQKNTVLVLEGLQNSVKPFWPGSSLFRELKENAKEWEEELGQDEQGEDCVFVTCTYTLDRLPGRRFVFRFQFDPETKFPVRMKIKDYSSSRPMEQYDMNEIVFNAELPDEIFEFEIPEGATVIEE